jgi:phage gpG-like protein
MVEVVVDDSRAVRAIDRAIEAGSDLTRVWQRFNKDVEAEHRQAFDTAGASSGANWAPLADSTKKSRLKRRGGNRGTVSRPLWDRGDLRRSLVQQSTDSVIVIEPHQFRRGTVDPKARFHHSGFKIKTAGERVSLRRRTLGRGTFAESRFEVTGFGPDDQARGRNIRTAGERTSLRRDTRGRGKVAGVVQVPARPLFGPLMTERLAGKLAQYIGNHLVGRPLTS